MGPAGARSREAQPGGDSSQGGGSEKRSEERHRNELTRYFDEVVAAIAGAEAVLVFGPGEAKKQLAERLGHATARPRPTIAIETSDKLTDAQVVAKVSNYFAGRLPNGDRTH